MDIHIKFFDLLPDYDSGKTTQENFFKQVSELFKEQSQDRTQPADNPTFQVKGGVSGLDGIVINKACELGAMAEVIELFDFVKFKDRMFSLLAEKEKEVEKIKEISSASMYELQKEKANVSFYIKRNQSLQSELEASKSEVNRLSELWAKQEIELEASKLKISEWREDYNTLGEELEAVKRENERLIVFEKLNENKRILMNKQEEQITEFKSQAEKKGIVIELFQTEQGYGAEVFIDGKWFKEITGLQDHPHTLEELSKNEDFREALSHYKLTVPTDIKK